MLPFSLQTVRSEQDAIAAAPAGRRYIAGGTTLVDLMPHSPRAKSAVP